MWSELPQILKLLLALMLVVALMGGLAYVLKRLGMSGAMPTAQKKKRLRVIESLPLDARRRLLIIARDNAEHLVILGANGETVVETDIGIKK